MMWSLLACADPAAMPLGLADTVVARVTDRSVPLTGGGLTVRGTTIVALDASGDRIWLGDSATGRATADLALPEGSWPFRVAMSDTHAYVTLRGSGGLAVVDYNAREVETVVPTCAEPRGVDVDGSGVVVVCADGAIVSHAADGQAVAIFDGVPDQRDVVLEGDLMWVSTFRTAALNLYERATFSLLESSEGGRVAWRLAAHPRGGVMMLHQDLPPDGTVFNWRYVHDPTPGSCGQVVDSEVSWFWEHNGHVQHLISGPLGGLTMATDIAFDGTGLAVLAATGNNPSAEVYGQHRQRLVWIDEMPTAGDCVEPLAESDASARPLGVAYDADGRLVALGSPFSVDVDGVAVAPVIGHESDAVRLFHQEPVTGSIACASCHPEGQDDGHTWMLDYGSTPRRTQQLAGMLKKRSPYHWGGELETFDNLMEETFVATFLGDPLTFNETQGLLDWLDGIEPVRVTPVGDSNAGALVWNDLQCALCHKHDKRTNNKLVDVGTGGAFKVPSLLGVGYRPPYRHDGCAATLADRFGHCADDWHPVLEGEDLDNLVALLQTM